MRAMKFLTAFEQYAALDHHQVLDAILHHMPSQTDVWHTASNAYLRFSELMPPKMMDSPTLLRSEDFVDWAVFSAVFLALILFDHFVLHSPNSGEMDFKRAVQYSFFWLACAAGFCSYVYWSRGSSAAFDWGTGYLLEWMLSVDNLFVFRSIFVIFHTPNSHKHKPLLWGIMGAIVFRMIFFVLGEIMIHTFWWMQLVLGIFLMYTGYKIVGMDEEEEDVPNENPIFRWVTRQIKLVDSYPPEPRFVACVAIDERTQEPVLPDWTPQMLPKDYDAAASDGDPTKGRDITFRYCATRLVLVTLCLELTDIAFAVDSVSAIIAQIPDLYLAYTACVFAMLGLRATFFALDELVKLFTLLPYAVSMILVFIGFKLVARGWIHIAPEVVCMVLVSVLTCSIIASVIWDKYKPAEGDEDASKGKSAGDLEADETIAKPQTA